MIWLRMSGRGRESSLVLDVGGMAGSSLERHSHSPTWTFTMGLLSSSQLHDVQYEHVSLLPP